MRMLFWEAIQKALQHKYIRRWRGKDGKWVYLYPDGSRHGDGAISGSRLDVKDEHIHEGASFSAGAGKGHYVVQSSKDGKVTFHHDEDKDKTPQTMTHDEFKAHIKGTHQDAAKRHAEAGMKKRAETYAAAMKHGKESHQKRANAEMQRWYKQHEEHLKSAEKQKPVDAQKPKVSDVEPEKEKRADSPTEWKEKRAAELKKRADSPTGWKEHLRERGTDPEHPYLQKHAERAQHLWDTWGVVLHPPDVSFQNDKDHEALWERMTNDLEVVAKTIDVKQLRDHLTAKQGVLFSLEEHISSSGRDMGGEEGWQVGGVFSAAESRLRVADLSVTKFTFFHELTHAADHLAATKGGFLSADPSSALQKHLDALPQAHLPSALSKDAREYYQDHAERAARAMEQFIPALFPSFAKGAEIQGAIRLGYYTQDQLREHADTFAAIAKSLGMPVKQEALDRFKNAEKERVAPKVTLDKSKLPKSKTDISSPTYSEPRQKEIMSQMPKPKDHGLTGALAKQEGAKLDKKELPESASERGFREAQEYLANMGKKKKAA